MVVEETKSSDEEEVMITKLDGTPLLGPGHAPIKIRSDEDVVRGPNGDPLLGVDGRPIVRLPQPHPIEADYSDLFYTVYPCSRC